MFDENSGLVKIWVREIKAGRKTIADVPDIDNLIVMVKKVLGIIGDGETEE